MRCLESSVKIELDSRWGLTMCTERGCLIGRSQLTSSASSMTRMMACQKKWSFLGLRFSSNTALFLTLTSISNSFSSSHFSSSSWSSSYSFTVGKLSSSSVRSSLNQPSSSLLVPSLGCLATTSLQESSPAFLPSTPSR